MLTTALFFNAESAENHGEIYGRNFMPMFSAFPLRTEISEMCNIKCREGQNEIHELPLDFCC